MSKFITTITADKASTAVGINSDQVTHYLSINDRIIEVYFVSGEKVQVPIGVAQLLAKGSS